MHCIFKVNRHLLQSNKSVIKNNVKTGAKFLAHEEKEKKVGGGGS